MVRDERDTSVQGLDFFLERGAFDLFARKKKGAFKRIANADMSSAGKDRLRNVRARFEGVFAQRVEIDGDLAPQQQRQIAGGEDRFDDLLPLLRARLYRGE